jgi:hypothetical protein
MDAINLQFRAALTFAYAWVIARVLASPLMEQAVDATAVLLTYVGLAIAALALYQFVRRATNVKAVRTLCFVVLGALCAAAPEFW